MTATTQGPTTHNAPRRAAAGFGRTLDRWLREHDMSQAELARRTGLDQSYISRLRANDRSPSPAALRVLAGALGLDPNRLIIESFCDAPFARRVVREMWGD